jgi:hypothetical protein
VTALVELDAIAIVRYVFRNNSVPRLGMLRPVRVFVILFLKS